MRSKKVIHKINNMKMKLGSKVMLRKTGKTRVYSELSAKAVNSAKRKRVKEVMDLGQCDDRLPGLYRTMTDVSMVPPVFIAGLRSASYQTKRGDRTLNGDTLELEIFSQCGESTLREFRPSRKRKRHRTDDPSGIQLIDSIGYRLD